MHAARKMIRHEKREKPHELFAHHNLVVYLHEFIQAAGIAKKKVAVV